jgi:hypothetical protein
LPSVGETMSVTRATESSSSKSLVRSTMPFVVLDDLGHELLAGEFAVLHLAQLVLPLAGHGRAW